MSRETKKFDDDLDIAELASYTKKVSISQDESHIVKSIAEKSSFASRGDNKKKPRKRSPYVIQKNIKMRIGMPELLVEVSRRLGVKTDQETLERGILALMEKEGLEDLTKSFFEIVADS